MKIKILTKDMNGVEEEKKYFCENKNTEKARLVTYKSEFSNDRILIFDNKVILERTGDLAGTLIFEENRTTDFDYKTAYFEKKMRCKTKVLKINETGFFADYDLYEGDELINKITINVKLGDGV